MNIEITDSGSCILFKFDSQYIAINKSSIKSIVVVGTDKVSMDIGRGTLELLYINYTEVAKPTEIDSAPLLLKILKDMISTSSGNQDVSALVAQLQQQLSLLAVPSYQTAAQILATPLLTDETQPGLVFQGFAATGTLTSDTGWAIKVIRDKNGVLEEIWANGRTTFINVWDDRYDLTYKLAGAQSSTSINPR